MRNRPVLVNLALLVALPATVAAQDPQSIMETMLEKQRERWQGVDSYVVDQTMMVSRVQETYQRVTVESAEGDRYDVFRPVPAGTDVCQLVKESDAEVITPEMYEQAAQGYEMTGEALGSEVDKGLDEAGLPRGLLAGGDPWATFDPRAMMGSGAMFMRAAADAKRQQATENEKPDTTIEEMQMFADKARFVGMEVVDGRDAFHLLADDLNLTQESDGQVFTINSVDSWVDAAEYVPLRMVLKGIATEEDESRPIEMEKRDLDYRRVPDSNMYESYRQVMRIAGVMDAEQQAEMQEAQKQMAEMERQLAQMPAGQRDMIMRQMGPQLEMVKKMASGGGVEFETVVHAITVNHCG